jgi:hypothetical protein
MSWVGATGSEVEIASRIVLAAVAMTCNAFSAWLSITSPIVIECVRTARLWQKKVQLTETVGRKFDRSAVYMLLKRGEGKRDTESRNKRRLRHTHRTEHKL